MGVLRGGMTLKPIGLSQKEMDFIDSRKMTRDIILSIFGVPKTIAGFTEDLNRATAEVQKRLFWQETVKPQLIRISTTLTNKFIYKQDVNMIAKFDFLQIDELQRNYESEVGVASKLWMMGFARNELNERFSLGFREDEEFGDDKYVPLNMMNLDDDPRTDTVGEPRETIQINTSIVPQIEKIDQRQVQIDELIQRNIKNYEKMMTGRMKKHFFSQRLDMLKHLDNTTDLNDFDSKDEKLVKMLMSIFNEAYKSAGEAALFLLDKETDEDYKIDSEIIFKYVNKSKKINKKVLENVRTQIEEGGTLDEIKVRVKRLYNYIDKRVNVVARSEITGIIKEVVSNEFKNNGITTGV
jgi:hypothetical protein